MRYDPNGDDSKDVRILDARGMIPLAPKMRPESSRTRPASANTRTADRPHPGSSRGMRYALGPIDPGYARDPHGSWLEFRMSSFDPPHRDISRALLLSRVFASPPAAKCARLSSGGRGRLKIWRGRAEKSNLSVESSEKEGRGREGGTAHEPVRADVVVVVGSATSSPPLRKGGDLRQRRRDALGGQAPSKVSRQARRAQ